MARPRKKGLDYFPHDCDASSDEKLEALIAIHGDKGYRFFFLCLERIYRSDNAELKLINGARALLMTKLGLDEFSLGKMLDTAFDVELFDRKLYQSRTILSSRGIKRRFNEVQRMRDNWRKKKEKSSIPRGKVFPLENAGRKPGENPEVTPQRKAKQSKEDLDPNLNITSVHNPSVPDPHTQVRATRVTSPIYAGKEFFRLSEQELINAQTWYRKNGLPVALIPAVIDEVEKWLHKDTPAALKARRAKTHYSYLQESWTIENASKMQSTGRNALPGMSRAEQAHQRNMELMQRIAEES